MDCRYLAYKNESIDKQSVAIRSMLHGRDVQSFVAGEPVSSLTGIYKSLTTTMRVITSIGNPFNTRHSVRIGYIRRKSNS